MTDDILTRIKKAHDEHVKKTAHDPKFIVLGKNEEYELLFVFREQLRHRQSGELIPAEETQTKLPDTLDGCKFMGMSILLEEDVLLVSKK